MTVCGRQGCGIRPDPVPPPPASRRRRGQGSPDAADTLRSASAVSRVAALPAAGRAVPPPRLARFARPSGGAPGAYQVVPQVPEAESVASFPAPGGPVGSTPFKCVCGGRAGKVEGEKEVFVLSPLVGRGAGASSCAPCSRLAFGARLGRAPCRVSSPHAVGEASRGRPWRPGPVNFRPLAGCEGCAARSRYLWTTAPCALVSLCALCSRLRPPFAEAVVRLPLPVPQTPTPRRRRPSVLAVARRGSVPGRGRCPPR